MDTHHVFYHDDIDGIISASLYLHYNKNMQSRLYPVTSIMRGEKFDSFFNQIIKGKDGKKIILDYQYNKQADLWIDHHFNPEFGECIIDNDKMLYDNKSESAASLVYDRFTSKNIEDETVLMEKLLNYVDIIDSCSYTSVRQVFKDYEAIMILRAYLEMTNPNDMTLCRIVEMISDSRMDVDNAIYRLRINSYYIKELEKSALKIKNSAILAKKIAITYERRVKQFPRYSEFLVFPEIKYNIRIINIGNGNIKFQLGYNPWHTEKNAFNLGKISKFNYVINSGGHFNVGAGIIKESDVERFVDDISQILNEEDDTMEKYAVDKEDAVEKTAEDLVKTGQANNITEARKLAVNKKPEASEEINEPRTA